MAKGVNKTAQTARILKVEILKKNGNMTPLTNISKSSTSFILVTSAEGQHVLPKCWQTQTKLHDVKTHKRDSFNFLHRQNLESPLHYGSRSRDLIN